MVETMRKILEGVLERLSYHLTTYLPSIVVAFIFIFLAYAIAVVVRWLLYKIFKGPAIDKFLRQSGVAFMIDPSGRLRATRLVAETAYWCILLSGFLVGLSVFKTDVTTQIVEDFVFITPKLVVAGLILLAGAWLSQYLGRSALVWAVNESLPTPRRLATAVRIVIMFVAVVVAADQLNFARNVFLAAFVILVGGAVLTASLAVGIGASSGVREFLKSRREQAERSDDQSVLHHL
jgi:flagellar biosynthesis protein FliQ